MKRSTEQLRAIAHEIVDDVCRCILRSGITKSSAHRLSGDELLFVNYMFALRMSSIATAMATHNGEVLTMAGVIHASVHEREQDRAVDESETMLVAMRKRDEAGHDAGN